MPGPQTASPGRGCSCLSSLCQSRDDGAHGSKTGAGLISCLPFWILIVGPHMTTQPGWLSAALLFHKPMPSGSPLAGSVLWLPSLLPYWGWCPPHWPIEAPHDWFPSSLCRDSVPCKASRSLSLVHGVLGEHSCGPARGDQPGNQGNSIHDSLRAHRDGSVQRTAPGTPQILGHAPQHHTSPAGHLDSSQLFDNHRGAQSISDCSAAPQESQLSPSMELLQALACF